MSVSAVYGHGKRTIWQKFKNNDVDSAVRIFENVKATEDEVGEAGLQLFSLLYCGKLNMSLNHLRFSHHMSSLAVSTHLPCPERLPPTEAAARFHSYRVHLQVMQWKLLLTDIGLRPEDWGWKTVDGHCMPVATDLDVAPSDILSIVRCKCRVDIQNSCNSMLCSCRKHGLQCVAACKNCIGISCCNASAVDSHLSDSDDENVEAIDAESNIQEMVEEDCLDFFMPVMFEESVE
jgi:hypothetical protein